MAIRHDDELLRGALEACFVEEYNDFAKLAHNLSRKKGWYETERSDGDFIALMHSELSEALEGIRKPGPDHHCPEFNNVEVELADTVLRIMDYGVHKGYRVAEAIVAKTRANEKRSHRHGGKAL